MIDSSIFPAALKTSSYNPGLKKRFQTFERKLKNWQCFA